MRWLDPPHRKTSILDGIHPLLAQALARRGISSREAARAFLDPDAYRPAPAAALPGLEAALERIAAAVRARDSICVWGDFDVDGQTATTVLVSTLAAIGANVTYHIPVRARENHGVNLPRLEEVIAAGAQLVLTCDTGIAAHEAVDYARRRGVEMVITDHHDPGPTLPEAAAVVNPKLLPPQHPLAGLAGVGVAYKLAEALLGAFASGLEPDSLTDLAALGLVADLARLEGDTRYLVQRGLARLRRAERLGLKAILELAEVDPAQLNETHIGFTLGPRLNALGRLSDANPAVELLTTGDAGRARALASQLEGLNTQRQLLTRQVHQAAESRLRAEPALLTHPVIVLAGNGWPGGVIGIAASRLVERYQKPVILLSAGADGILRGSARSIEGIHITDAIATQRELLLNFGGHPMAAGLSLAMENLPAFQRGLDKAVAKAAGEIPPEPTLQVDAWLPLDEASLDLAETLETLAPYGSGNEQPILAARGLAIVRDLPIGRAGEHRKLTVQGSDGIEREVLWWNGAGEPLPDGGIDLAYTLRPSNFRGQRQASIELVAVRPREDQEIVIARQRPELVDWRVEAQPRALLAALPLPYLVWAEGPDKDGVQGRDRNQLEPAALLVVWTAPASPACLQTALGQVKPGRVALAALSPGTDEPAPFLSRLAGLVKFAINQRGGRASLGGLAAAMAARDEAIRAGLEWLAAGGQVRIEAGTTEDFILRAARNTPDHEAQARWLSALEFSLSETAAYREFLRTAAIEGILPA
ncbi:MAG: single-stranded-DNA-specific exonuclease RecJ [Chloroflexi bacterium]|nr:single-stranded-DNA-specific exonuclease RecJ [Chloroflexota bacterium]